LHNIIDRTYLRVFYDATLRQSKIREVAKEYGMENEADLDDFFQVEYTNKAIEIKPRMKELFKINESSNAYLKEQMLPKRLTILEGMRKDSLIRKMILVIRKHRYYDQLHIELFEGATTRDGKIKNPIVLVDPQDLIWKSQHVEEVKFYTGVLKFQNNYTTAKSESDIEGLKMIANNPLNLDVFYHNKEVSENVTASSIVAIELKTLPVDIKLTVLKRDPFYEVSGDLIINDKIYPFKTVNVRYNYFIHIGNTFHLIADADVFRMIGFFKSNNLVNDLIKTDGSIVKSLSKTDLMAMLK
jgi:hypothetical protein